MTEKKPIKFLVSLGRYLVAALVALAVVSFLTESKEEGEKARQEAARIAAEKAAEPEPEEVKRAKARSDFVSEGEILYFTPGMRPAVIQSDQDHKIRWWLRKGYYWAVPGKTDGDGWVIVKGGEYFLDAPSSTDVEHIEISVPDGAPKAYVHMGYR